MLRFLAFALLLGAMLVVEAPAWLVARRVAADTSGWIELRQPAGTMWNGSAEAVVPLPSPAAASIALGRIAWKITGIDWPSRSLAASIEQIPPAPRPLRLIAGSDRTVLTGAIRAPAAVTTRVPQLAGWSVAGTLVLDAESIEWSARDVTGNATIRWQNAVLAPANLPDAIALGDVTARASASANGIALTITNTGGSVQLSGTADPRTGQVDLQLQPRPEASPAQTAWLRSHLLPAPGAGNSYAIRFTLPGRR